MPVGSLGERGRWRRGGPAPRAADWSRWAGGARQALGLTAAAPLAVQRMPGGPVLRSGGPRDFYAALTGQSGAAYSWVQAFPEPGGTWRMTPAVAAGNLNAWEYNGVSAPTTGDAIVRIREVLPGEFRFRYLKQGTVAPCDATFAPAIGGCVLGAATTLLAGSELTLRDDTGTIVPTTGGPDTCVTNSSGAGCSWNVVKGRTYTLTAESPFVDPPTDPPTRKPYYQATTYTFTAACGTTAPVIRLPITDGYVCCPPCGDAPAGIPLPVNLTLDYMKGTVGLVFTPSFDLGPGGVLTNVWYGHTLILSDCDDWEADAYGACVNQGKQEVGVDFFFQCNPPKLLYSLPGLCCTALTEPLPPDAPPPQFSVSGDRTSGPATLQSGFGCDPPLFTFVGGDGGGVRETCFYSGIFGVQTTSVIMSRLFCVFGNDPVTFRVYH